MTSRRRQLQSVCSVVVTVVIVLLFFQGRVRATNHDIHLKEVMAGANGNSKIQFIVIEQEASGQNLWGPTNGTQSAAMLVFFDAAGRETGKFKFPSNPNTTPPGGTAKSLLTLIATQEFANLPGAPTPDFTIPPLLSPISGKVCFKNNPANSAAFPRNECVSYGNFTGNTENNFGSDNHDPLSPGVPAGPPAPALATTNTVSLRRTLDTDQNSDFVIVTTPTASNTAGVSFTIPVATQIKQGENLFTNEPFLGNGRTCASCHVASQSFRLPPSNVQSRFATLSSTFDPLFIAETAPSSFDAGFDFGLNLLVLTGEVASNVPCTGELKGMITTTAGARAKVLTRVSPKAYLVYGGINPALSGTVTDGNSCSGTVASITAGNVAAPAGSGVNGLEDPMRMRRSGSTDFPQGRALILENIDGFTNPPVFRKSPHLINLSRTAPFGFSGDVPDLRTFATGAVIQHFTRPGNFTIDVGGNITIDSGGVLSTRRSTGPNPDFRLPTQDELAAIEAFLLSLEFPSGSDPDKFNLDRFAVTDAQKRGRDAFFGPAKCSECHGGPVLAQTTVSILGKPIGVNASFNTGVVNQAINSAGVDNLPCEPSVGQCGSREFSVPQLFNVKNLAPFFHDGSAATVRQAVEFYTSPAFNNSPAGIAIQGIVMPSAMIDDIVAFLEGLTAGSILANSPITLTGGAGAAVSPRPSVLVRGGDGNPAPGITVTFAIGTGGGSVTGSTQITDASGIATVGSWILGAGVNTLTATASGVFQGNPVPFSATGNPLAVITSISPPGGVVGATLAVTITGTNLLGARNSDFGRGVTVSIGTGGTATSLPAIVRISPGTAPGPHTITVTTDAGPSAPFSSFTVTTGVTLPLVWGSNDSGQLGFANPAAEFIPGPVAGLGAGNGVIAIASGGDTSSPDHSLALKSDGSVFAWGGNDSGQLGDGSTISRAAPVPVNGLGSGSGAIAIAAGIQHSLALKSDGTVLAWGSNSLGQLGDGTVISRRIPTGVTGLGPGSGIIAIAAGDQHGLALKSDGSVLAWGANFSGQLGDGTTIQRITPVQVSSLGPGSGVVTIAAGKQYSLALKSDGTVLAWGANFNGQLGDGTSIGRTTPVQVAGLGAGSGVIAIAGGGQHSLALKSDGTVLAWGANFNAQLGDGTLAGRNTPGPVKGLGPSSGASGIAAGTDYSLARKSDGSMLAWGNNNFSQLGTGTLISRADAPVPVAGFGPGSGVIGISAATTHSMALKADGSVLAWGNNLNGQLGNGNTDGKVNPFPLASLNGTVAVAASNLYSLALKSDGSVLAWGSNGGGQLGDGTFTARPTPAQVAGFGPASGVIAVAAGSQHSLALKSDGSVFAWGANFNGQLGDGTFAARTAPVQVTGLGPGSGVIAIAAGDQHNLALKSDGSVLAWGANFNGQLGDGTFALRTAPVQVTGLGSGSGVIAIAGGSQHSLALKSDGSVLAWGANFQGQLGDGTFTPRPGPVQVASLGPGSDVIAIASGNQHSLALKSDGSVFAWGGNFNGQLGDGTNNNRNAPAQVTGLGPGSGVIAIASGFSHNIALKFDGSALAWGNNVNGQLGDGTFGVSIRNTPVPISSMAAGSGAIAIAAGFNHSMAVETTAGPPVLPRITGIDPASGTAGTTLSALITGTDLTGATSVDFSGAGVAAMIGTGGTATGLSVIITITTSATTDTRSFTVTTGAGTSAPFTGFTVTPPIGPAVSGIAPSSGTAGTLVSANISGTNLTGATAVTFSGTGVMGTVLSGGTAASLPISIAIDAGAATDTRTFTVTTGAGTSAPFTGFTVVPSGVPSVPAITGITPSSATTGTTVPVANISGTNLAGATAVTFSGTGVTGIVLSGGTTTSLPISIAIDPGAATNTRTFTVTTGAGTSAPFAGFTVTTGAPPIINDLAAMPPGLSQSLAPLYGGSFDLIVNGQNFAPGTELRWGSAALSTSVISATQLKATVPTAQLTVPGAVLVTAVSSSGTSNAVSVKVIERGDINGDRNVNIGDALVCSRTVGGINRPALPLTVGDVKLSGSVNIGDCLVLALFAVRAIPNLPTPTVSTVSPIAPNRGGTLTITGTGFSAIASDNRVLFTSMRGGTTKVIPSAATTTSLTVTIPPDAVSGALQIYRQDLPLMGGQFPLTISGTSTPLALMQVSPFFNVTRGSSVTLTGLGFSATPASNTVLFRSATGTTPGTVTAATAGSLTVTVPADAICGPVTVTVGGQTTDGRIAAVAGTNCGVQLAAILGNPSPGETMVLEGAGFDVVTPANNIVRFTAAGGGTVNATVIHAAGSQLQLHVPETAAAGNVTVAVAGTASNPLMFVPPPPTVPASVDVVVTSPVAVGSYQITIGFDKNIVTLDAANVKGGTGAGFTDVPATINVDNNAGTVTINNFQIGSAPSGTFTVANLVFTPVTVGTSPLTVSGVTLTNTDGDDLPGSSISLSSGSIIVLRVP
jgi:alpha-tubulin suppressor-like RCC1 family protein